MAKLYMKYFWWIAMSIMIFSVATITYYPFIGIMSLLILLSMQVFHLRLHYNPKNGLRKLTNEDWLAPFSTIFLLILFL